MRSSFAISILALSLALPGTVFAEEPQTAAGAASATVLENGSVEVTGITQPGRDAGIPEQCASEADHTALVVCTANAFLETLSEDQRAKVVLPLAEENSTAWSNLPCADQCRVGILMSDLDETQQQAALSVMLAASSDQEDDGFDEITKIMMADGILTVSQASGDGGGPGGPPPEGMTPPDGMAPPEGMAPPDGSGSGGPGLNYSSETYLIAFLGEPSTSDTWQLQFGGHHLAVLRTFSGGSEVSSTPNFIGVEPKVWIQDGVTYAPLEDDRDAMVAMLAALTDDQRTQAKLSTSFSDVLLGPGEDGQFPQEKQGLAVSELDEAQQQAVLTAINEWVGDTASSSAEAMMERYAEQLDETYIAFSGNATLNNHADYVRIDGPGVWIEFVCQNGVVYGDQIHYHTIWRDREYDYGAVYDFTGSAS